MNNSLRRALSQPQFYYLLHAFVFVVVLGIAWFVSGKGISLRSLQLHDYDLQQCDITSASEGAVLDVLDAVYMEDVSLLDSICKTKEIARHYGSVALRSVHRDQIDMRDIYELRYELVLAKPELMSSLRKSHQGKGAYQLIAQYPDYGSQLISQQGIPELTAAWLKGKRLGLLDDPNSVSAYQIPVAALRNAGLSDVPQIIYFRSYRQMIRALFSGQVDVIAFLLSPEGPDSRLKLPPGLVLEQTLPGPGWYLERSLFNTPMHCDIVAALQQLSSAATLDYIKGLRVLEHCSGSGAASLNFGVGAGNGN